MYLTGNGNSAWSIRSWNVIRKFPSDNLKGWSWTGYADHEPCEDTINIQTMTTMLMATNARNILQRLDVFRQQSGRLICLRMRSSSRLRIYQIIFKIFEELLTIVCMRVILHIEQERWTGDAVKITASPFSNVNRRWHYG